MTWSDLDWSALERLRQRFLSGAIDGPYWQDAGELAAYDLTYAERIGWKWDHVLRELILRGWKPRSRRVLDWGCGSGVASRRVIAAFGPGEFEALALWDHSPAACDFAAEAAGRAFPPLAIHTVTPGFLTSDEPVGLLVISHVLNELAPAELDRLHHLILRAEAVLWVEPGTHDVSRSLGSMRDVMRSTFTVVAPCTHLLACPVLAPGRERDWCHFFAPPPSEIFANSDWVKFGQRAGIDLRSLPYGFIALDRVPNALLPDGWSRVLGRPEHFKPYARFLNCDASGLAELTVMKRTAPALYKELDRTRLPLVYRWTREGEQVSAAESLPFPAEKGPE